MDDRTIQAAAEAGRRLDDLTEEYLRRFLADCAALGVERADLYPRTSEHLDDMVSLAEKLAKRARLTKSCAPCTSTFPVSRSTASSPGGPDQDQAGQDGGPEGYERKTRMISRYSKDRPWPS
jgi:hypothetical protein